MASDEKTEEQVGEWERRFAALPAEDRAHLDGIPEAERSFRESEPELRRVTK